MADDREPLQQYYQTDSDSDSECNSFPPEANSSSVFGESKLGDPRVAQNIVIDFTPIEEIDNDVAQKKCCAFWDFIKSRTDLHHMLVLPDEEIVATNKTTEISDMTGSEFRPTRIGKKVKTAVSMLEVVEGKGLIDRIFEARLQQTNCSLGSREYLRDESTKHEQKTNTATCTCSKICKSCRNVSKQSRGAANGASSPGVQALCQKLQAWDNEHSKSMKPPGHAPALTNCIMQRKVIM